MLRELLLIIIENSCFLGGFKYNIVAYLAQMRVLVSMVSSSNYYIGIWGSGPRTVFIALSPGLWTRAWEAAVLRMCAILRSHTHGVRRQWDQPSQKREQM